MKPVEKIDLFGFLPVKLATSFDDVMIEPLEDYDERLIKIKQMSHKDGFIYPPIVQQWKAHPITLKPIKRIPNTKRPAHLYKLLSSHRIIIESDREIDELRIASSGFLMHLIAYIYGVRLQFHDWWVDGRIQIKSQYNVHIEDKFIADFLLNSYKTWNCWNKTNKSLMTNILYMHNRAPSYEWDWERFIIEYMVFDGCCALAKSLIPRLKLSDHTKRLLNICNYYNIPIEKRLIKRIVYLRNQLFHSTLWSGRQPCTAPPNDAFIIPYHLARLNNRIIPALLGHEMQYIQTPWWNIGYILFQ
jgi:hypothetical protein